MNIYNININYKYNINTIYIQYKYININIINVSSKEQIQQKLLCAVGSYRKL